jgi:radical SAM superfamily enzyme YgiQ (UPF0313 family)
MGSLGLLSNAGVVPEDIDVEFFDENMEEIDLSQPFDLVAIGGNTGQMDRALAICDQLRKRDIPLVAGGAAAITFPDQFTRRNVYVVLGEGEVLFPRFIRDFLSGNAKPVYERTEADNYVDLENIPLPRYDLAAKYPYSMVGLQVSRGCPYDCNFCQVSKIYGKKYRYKTVERAVQELKIVRELWKDSFLFFYDDNPFFNKTFAVNFFNRVYEEKIDLGRWGANSNVTLYKDEELMSLMTRQGPMAFLGIGLESLSENVLDTINNSMKVNHAAEYETAMKTFKKYRINPVAYFMFGFEANELDDLEGIKNFCLRNKVDSVLTRVTPMPGTGLYDDLKHEYEQTHRTLKKSNFAEFGVIKKYLNEKTGIEDQRMQEHIADVYSELYSDANYHSDGPIPFYFLF